MVSTSCSAGRFAEVSQSSAIDWLPPFVTKSTVSEYSESHEGKTHTGLSSTNTMLADQRLLMDQRLLIPERAGLG